MAGPQALAAGLVLLGHGSRDPQWRGPIEAVARRVAELSPQLAVRCAWLELCEPDLLQAAGELAAQGVTQVTIVPMFLGMGRHAREDLPRLVDELRRLHPQLRWAVRPAVGEDPRTIAWLAELVAGDVQA